MPQELFSLANQVALVTGASSGLGRHFALTLARAGAKVAIAARRTDKLEALAKEIAAADARALPVPLDVTDLESVNAAVDALSPFGVTELEMPLTPARLWEALRGRA